jgi:hypothetical protein
VCVLFLLPTGVQTRGLGFESSSHVYWVCGLFTFASAARPTQTHPSLPMGPSHTHPPKAHTFFKRVATSPHQHCWTVLDRKGGWLATLPTPLVLLGGGFHGQPLNLPPPPPSLPPTPQSDAAATGSAAAASSLFLNYINGAFVPSSDGTTLPVTNPATNATVGDVPRSKEEDVNAGNSSCLQPHNRVQLVFKLPGLGNPTLSAAVEYDLNHRVWFVALRRSCE